MSETSDSETESKTCTKRRKKNALPGGRAFAGSADEQRNQTDDPQVKRIEHVEKVLGECGFGAAGTVVHGQEGDDQREHKFRVDGQHGQGFGQRGVGDEGHDEQQRAEREIEQIAQQDAVAAQVGDEHEGQDNDAALGENGCEEHQKDHAADAQRERAGACERAQHEHTEREGKENVVVDGQRRVGSDQIVNGVAGRHDGRPDEQTQDIALAVVGVAEAVDREKGEEYTDTAGQNVENTGKLDGEQTGNVVDVVKDHENGHK